HFVFEAADGIRDVGVTGVQAFALPIAEMHGARIAGCRVPKRVLGSKRAAEGRAGRGGARSVDLEASGGGRVDRDRRGLRQRGLRSEERRVGKEGGGRWERED